MLPYLQNRIHGSILASTCKHISGRCHACFDFGLPPSICFQIQTAYGVSDLQNIGRPNPSAIWQCVWLILHTQQHNPLAFSLPPAPRVLRARGKIKVGVQVQARRLQSDLHAALPRIVATWTQRIRRLPDADMLSPLTCSSSRTICTYVSKLNMLLHMTPVKTNKSC